jgi:hypothetical protein
LGSRKFWQRQAREAEVEPVRHSVRRYEIHAARQILDHIRAKVFRLVFLIPVSERNASGSPATALSAAGQQSDSVNKLVSRVSFPMRRLATTCHDNAGPTFRPPRFALDRRGQMHDTGDRAQDALGMVNQAHDVSQTGLTAEV